jgi:ParB family chromosome partitioning protein
MPLAHIKVGERIRKDFGDIAELAASIKDNGLLQPILVTPDGLLLCGERRLRAFELLGRTEIPVLIRGMK